MKKTLITVAATLMVAFLALRLAGPACWAEDDWTPQTDYNVKVYGERLKDARVAMSCRMGTFAPVGKFTELINDNDFVLFRTDTHGVPVYLPKNNPDLIAQAQQFQAKDEITVFGYVRWSPLTGSYFMGGILRKGFTCGYDNNAATTRIRVHVSEVVVDVEPGETKPIPCPHCQSQLLISWEK